MKKSKDAAQLVIYKKMKPFWKNLRFRIHGDFENVLMRGMITIILKFFEQRKFQRERIFENKGEVREILADFSSENGFELTKHRRINV